MLNKRVELYSTSKLSVKKLKKEERNEFKMAKYYCVPTSGSTHSIDISKPEGISSFWNLCSKNDKQPMQQGIDSPKMNINSFALKLLKLKGIDLTNVDNFEGGDFQALTQNKNFIVLSSNQTKLNKKDLSKQKMFVDILNNQHKIPKEESNLEPRMFPRNGMSMNSNHTRLIKSSMMCSGFKKEKFYDPINKTGLQPSNDCETVKLLSSSRSERKMFPEEKQKKRIKKRMMVPIYIRKKSNNFESFDKKYIVSSCDRQDEAVDLPSLIKKIKAMETKLNHLETKTKKQLQSEVGALKRTEIVNNYALTKSRPMELNEEKLYENNVNLKTKKSNNKNVPLIQFYPKDNQSKKKTLNKGIERIEEMLSDPNILIKNHNLVIPSTITEESLFKANPSAGCDTILKLFDALSEKSKHSNQSNDHPKSFVEQINWNSTNCDSKEIKHIPATNNFCIITSNDGESERTVHDTTKNMIKKNNVEANFLLSSRAEQNIHDFCGGNIDNAQNIYSLPIVRSPSTLKLCDQKISDEGRNKITNDHVKEEATDCSNSVDRRDVNSVGLKTDFTKIQDQGGNKTVIEKLPTSELQSNNNERRVDFGNNTEIVLDDTMKDQDYNFERQEVTERTLNKLKVGLEKTETNHQLQDTSPPSTKKDGEVNSLDPVTNNIHKINLNIYSEQCKTTGMSGQPKLLKKTTIACPVNSPDKRISITILIEKNPKDDKSIPRDVKTPFIDAENSSIILKNENLILEKKQTVPDNIVCMNNTLESFVIDNLLKKHLPSLGLSTRNNIGESTVDKTEGIKQNECGDFFGLSSKVKYLTKEQRQAIDKNKLWIGDRHIKSEGLPTLDLMQPKSVFTGLKNRFDKVNTGTLEQLNNYAREGGKMSPLGLKTKNKYILHRSERYNPKNSLTAQSFREKVQSKTKIVELDSFYKRKFITENINYEKHPLKYMKCPSLPIIKNEMKDEQGSHKHRTKSNYCPTCRKISQYISKDKKNILEQNERPCRFRLTLNEEALVRQVEKDSPVSIVDEKIDTLVSQEMKSDFEKFDNNFHEKIMDKSSDFDGHKFVFEKTFVDNDLKLSPVNELVYSTLQCNDQTDLKTNCIQEYTSNSCDVSPIDKSNISECKQDNSNSKSCETEENTLKSGLSSLLNKELQGQNEPMSTEKNKLQDDSLIDSNNLLNLLENQITNTIEIHDNDSLEVDAKPICHEYVRNYSPQNMFNTNRDSLESIEEEPESLCYTKEDTSCWSCTHGCLIVPEDWNEEPEE